MNIQRPHEHTGTPRKPRDLTNTRRPHGHPETPWTPRDPMNITLNQPLHVDICFAETCTQMPTHLYSQIQVLTQDQYRCGT